MPKKILLFVTLVAIVAGCARISESRLNPLNWFGRDTVVEAATPAEVAMDPRPLVQQVISLRAEQAPGGAVITAVGLPPTQGFWQPALIGPERQGAVLIYQFRVAPPPGGARVSTQASREITVGTFVSDQALAGVLEIRVLGAASSRAIRR